LRWLKEAAMSFDAALNDLCELIVDCPHSTPKWTDAGVLVLRSHNIRGGRLHLSDRSFTDEEHYKQRSRRTEVRAGDLVITREAPMGEVCMIPKNLRCCLGQRMVLLRPDSRKCDGRFLLYAIQSPTVQNQISWSEGTGSTVSNLRIPHLEALRIPTPTLAEQHAIASVLGALDDKIEQNRRTGRALETLAQATFKAWFVDFEPVKAKAAGQTSFPGMCPAAFAALADRLTVSALGPVPQGWQVRSVGDIATLSKQQIDPRDHADESFEHFSIPAFDAGQNPVVEPGGGIKSQKFVVVPGCILVSKLNPRIARVWLPSHATGLRQIASTEFLVVVPKVGWARETIYCLFQQKHFRESLAQSASGTSNSHQRVRPADFLTRPLVAPAQPILDAFAEQVVPQIALRDALQHESRKLIALREYLLPRLLSGRVRLQACQVE
jgi:type I restriction enzyme, S subunit